MTRVLKSSLRAHRHCFSLYVQYLAAICCASSAANGSCCECEPYEDCRHLSFIDFFCRHSTDCWRCGICGTERLAEEFQPCTVSGSILGARACLRGPNCIGTTNEA